MSLERNKQYIIRTVGAASIAAASFFGRFDGKSPFQLMDHTAEASPNFCTTTYKSAGDITPGDTFYHVQIWNGKENVKTPDAFALRYSNVDQKLVQQDVAGGMWIERKSGTDIKKPLDLQIQIDPANFNQLKNGEDAAVLTIKGGWSKNSGSIPSQINVYDLSKQTPLKVSEASFGDDSNSYVVLPENMSKFGLSIQHEQLNALKINLGSAKNPDLKLNESFGIVADLRGKVSGVMAEACVPVAPLKEVPVVPANLPVSMTNELATDVWSQPFIWHDLSQQRLPLNNALKALRYGGTAGMSLKQDKEQGKFYIESKQAGRVQTDMRIDNARLNEVIQTGAGAALSINYPGWAALDVNIYDTTDPKNPLLVGSGKTDTSGFFEVVFGKTAENSWKNMSITIDGITVPTSGAMNFNPVEASRLADYAVGKVTNGVDVSAKLRNSIYFKTNTPIIANQYGITAQPGVSNPEKTPVVGISGPKLSRIIALADPDYQQTIAQQYDNVTRNGIRFYPRDWQFGIGLALPEKKNGVKYENGSFNGEMLVKLDSGTNSADLGVILDQQYLSKYKKNPNEALVAHLNLPEGVVTTIQFLDQNGDVIKYADGKPVQHVAQNYVQVRLPEINTIFGIRIVTDAAKDRVIKIGFASADPSSTGFDKFDASFIR